MTQPEDAPPIGESTDIDLDAAQVEAADDADTPATSDPDELTDDGALGGTGGPGGAG
jgi:hypothetical protein